MSMIRIRKKGSTPAQSAQNAFTDPIQRRWNRIARKVAIGGAVHTILPTPIGAGIIAGAAAAAGTKLYLDQRDARKAARRKVVLARLNKRESHAGLYSKTVTPRFSGAVRKPKTRGSS